MKRLTRTMILALAGAALVQMPAYAKPAANPDTKGAHNAIVGLWNVQATIENCTTGEPEFSFPAMHKFELGGTGQVVPATNPAMLSAHMMVWRHIKGGEYLASIKMFRFDGNGNYIGWIELNNEVTINKAGDAYQGSGIGTIYNAAGVAVATSCPSLVGTRFTGNL